MFMDSSRWHDTVNIVVFRENHETHPVHTHSNYLASQPENAARPLLFTIGVYNEIVLINNEEKQVQHIVVRRIHNAKLTDVGSDVLAGYRPSFRDNLWSTEEMQSISSSMGWNVHSPKMGSKAVVMAHGVYMILGRF